MLLNFSVGASNCEGGSSLILGLVEVVTVDSFEDFQQWQHDLVVFRNGHALNESWTGYQERALLINARCVASLFL